MSPVLGLCLSGASKDPLFSYTMEIGATYLCPVRGLAGLEPPDNARLGQAARASKDLGLDSLTLPVLEEALLGPGRAKARYLDGILSALDRIAEAGLAARILVPAQRLLGLDWIPPYLASARPDPTGRPAFLQGRIRAIRPFNWWEDPLVVQRRMRLVHELAGALSGHPAIHAWVLLDGLLVWAPPDPQSADFFLKAHVAEIRERHVHEKVRLRFAPGSLLSPDLLRGLASQVDGLESTCVENGLGGVERPWGLSGESSFAAYLGTLAQWLFGRPVGVELGRGALGEGGEDPERIMQSAIKLACQSLSGVHWSNLADPEPSLALKPPWSFAGAFGKSGILDRGLEPKRHAEEWVRVLRKTKPRPDPQGFLDIDRRAYLESPAVHFPRLWDHFREWS